MIVDHVKNKELYSEYKDIYAALSFIVENPEQTYHSTTKKNFTIINVSSISKSVDECIFESHNRFIDIHYVTEGIERISVVDIDKLHKRISYSEEDDITLFGAEENIPYTSVCLSPGMFLVCFPKDAHRVGEIYRKQQQIKKIVVKVPII